MVELGSLMIRKPHVGMIALLGLKKHLGLADHQGKDGESPRLSLDEASFHTHFH